MAVERAQAAEAASALGVSTGGTQAVEYAAGVPPPAERAAGVASRPRTEPRGAAAVLRELDQRGGERAPIARRHEDASLTLAEQRPDLSEIGGDRARSGRHVFDDLER